tara:strand:+ start:1871 stop:2071 length:201 start_codon:yes stop_codon:yes gene_type:complete
MATIITSLVTLKQIEERSVIFLIKGWSKEEIDLCNKTFKFIITNSMKLNIVWKITDTGTGYIFSKR